RALRGATVRAVERRGKHQLIHLDDGRVIHVHFRLNGDWHIGQASKALPRFARAALLFADGTRVVLEDSRALSTLDVHRAGSSPARLAPGTPATLPAGSTSTTAAGVRVAAAELLSSGSCSRGDRPTSVHDARGAISVPALSR